MNETAKIRTLGNLDCVVVDDRTITIEGWAASEGAGKVTNFQSRLAGHPCQVIEQSLHIPSTDVKLVWPNMDDSDCCRFLLRLVLPDHLINPLKDLHLSVAPSFGQHEGKMLQFIVAPSLPDPPESLTSIVGTGFREAALEFLDYFINNAGLKPTDNVLDIGCGVGRMTYGLTNYLDTSARYEGFDIIPELITWAQQEISTRFQNFQFQQVPIFNSFYNPTGHLKPTEFIFPYQESSFEFIFLTSVFTHMSGDAIRHYLNEIRRVLKPGGRGLITCFLLNSESNSLIENGKSTLNLSNPCGDGKVADLNNPDYAVGYDENTLKEWLSIRNLEVVDTLYGNWCGRTDFVSFQDILILQG